MAYQTPINPTAHGHLYRSLGKTIRYYRKKMGLSQAKLADAIGSKSPDYISKLERQKELTQPSLEFLFVLADIFRIKPRDFFEDAHTPETKAFALDAAIRMLKNGHSIKSVSQTISTLSFDELLVLEKHLKKDNV